MLMAGGRRNGEGGREKERERERGKRGKEEQLLRHSKNHHNFVIWTCNYTLQQRIHREFSLHKESRMIVY